MGGWADMAMQHIQKIAALILMRMQFSPPSPFAKSHPTAHLSYPPKFPHLPPAPLVHSPPYRLALGGGYSAACVAKIHLGVAAFTN